MMSREEKTKTWHFGHGRGSTDNKVAAEITVTTHHDVQDRNRFRFTAWSANPEKLLLTGVKEDLVKSLDEFIETLQEIKQFVEEEG